MRPLVVFHVRAAVEGLHAYAAREALGTDAGRARRRGRGGRFATELQNGQKCETPLNVTLPLGGGGGGCRYLHLLQNTVGQPRSEVELFRFRALGLGLVDDPYLIVLLITGKKKWWIYSVEIFFKMICMIRNFFFFFNTVTRAWWQLGNSAVGEH